MLTKNLAKYSIRKDRVIPFALKLSDSAVREMATKVILAFERAEGKTEAEILEELGVIPTGKKGQTLQGLFKLQNDRVEYADLGAEVCDRRWQLIRRAQDLRSEKIWDDPNDFLQEIADEFGDELSQLQEHMYADLPQFKTCKRIQAYDVEGLIHRYNCAQVQSLLLHALKVDVDLRGNTTLEQRQIHQKLKFHRLLNEQIDVGRFTLSGPLNMTTKAQMYGDRLATFFPHLLNLSKFTLTATVKLGSKRLQLKVSDKNGIVSHYRKQSGYIPPEFSLLESELPKLKQGLRVSLEADSIKVPGGDVIVPDLTIHQGENKRHIVLFHRWHQARFTDLLAKVEASQSAHLVFGISREIAKKENVKTAIETSRWFQENGFLFADFPTPKQVINALS